MRFKKNNMRSRGGARESSRYSHCIPSANYITNSVNERVSELVRGIYSPLFRSNIRRWKEAKVDFRIHEFSPRALLLDEKSKMITFALLERGFQDAALEQSERKHWLLSLYVLFSYLLQAYPRAAGGIVVPAGLRMKNLGAYRWYSCRILSRATISYIILPGEDNISRVRGKIIIRFIPL